MKTRLSRKDIPDSEVLFAYMGSPWLEVSPIVTLSEKYPEKLVYAKVEHLIDRGFIECGTSPRWGWLTDKGKEALHG